MSITLYFDNNSEYLSKELGTYGVIKTIEEFDSFSKKNRNENIINIISSADEIIENIDLIIEKLKLELQSYPDCRHVTFDVEKIVKISEVFDDLEQMTNQYAKEKLIESIQEIFDLDKDVERIREGIEELEMVIDKHSLMYDDKYDLLFEIEEKYQNDFPPNIYELYKDLEEEKILKNEAERKAVEEKERLYEEYIFSKYQKEFSDLAEEKKVEYQEELAKKNDKLKEILKEQEKIREKNETYYLEECIKFLNRSKSSIIYIKNAVDILFCIGFENDDFDWKSLSKERRLCLLAIYNRPWNIGIKIPECTFSYVVKDKNKFKFIESYSTEKYKDNKNKPFINIMNDFKNRELIELQEYKCLTIEEVMNVLLYQLKISNCQVNKCFNCNKYFIPQSKTNEKYCDRISPQNPKRTCKEYGAKKTYREEIKSFPIKRLHTNISQAYRMRINRSKNDEEKTQYKQEFDKYKEKFHDFKAQYKDGKLSEEKFIEWLEKQ